MIPPSSPTNAELVAYLDGELSPADSVRIGQRIAADRATAERAKVLMNGARPYRDAFEPLLAQAPTDRLEAMLGAVTGRQQPAPRAKWSRRRWGGAIAAALALMGLGGGVDRLVVRPVGAWLSDRLRGDDEAAEWREQVAQYLSLYTRDTLTDTPEGDDAKRRRLTSLGTRLGLDLNPTRVDFPGIEFKEAETLDYEGRTLGFLAYLDPKSGPVALCILAGAGDDSPIRTEQRAGMTIFYWSRSGRGFMLVGRGAVDELQAKAQFAAGRFGGAPREHGDQRG